MKAVALILLFAVCYAECRKIVPTINKNANIDFINMESGGVRKPAVVEPPKPAAPAPVATTKAPAVAPAAKPVAPPQSAGPAPAATPAPIPKPAQQPAKPVQPAQPPQVKPVPVNPSPAANPITTPGPGSVKALVNFYDSQGKASVIRPYSYSQAVKQG